MNKIPKDYEFKGDAFTNFDHSIEDGIEDKLKTSKSSYCHSAYDYYGIVWFSDGQFHEEVWQYNIHMETISSSSLSELITKVTDKWGDN